MGPRRDGRAADELRQSKQRAAGGVAAVALLVVITVPMLHPSPGELLATHLVALGAAGAATVVALVPWPARDRRVLLAFPVLGVASLVLLGGIASGVAQAYTALLTISFVYVGCTQPPGTSLALAATAAPAWIVVSGGVSPRAGLSLATTAVAWVAVGETLSASRGYRHRAGGSRSGAPVTDALTGLASRRELGGVLAGASPGDAVVLVDLDDFRAVNDRLGRQGGDRVLAEFAACTGQLIRRGDVALRYGGEELLLVLRQGGAGGADRTLSALRARWASSEHPTFSAGIAVHGDGGPSRTLRLADEALYRAKRLGGNQWRYAHLEDLAHRALVPEGGSGQPTRRA